MTNSQDREIYRELPDDLSANTIYVTKDGEIKLVVGMAAVTMPLEAWHSLGLAVWHQTTRVVKRERKP